MKTVSDEFKQAAIAPVKQIRSTVNVIDGGVTSATYTESDYIQSISFESCGELFGSIGTTITLKLLGANYDLVGKKISVKYGLVVDNDVEEINFGTFTVSEQSTAKDKESTTVKAISQMMVLQNTEYSEIAGFPMTVSAMAQEIADRFQLTLSDMSSLPNASFVIQEELYSHITGENYRNILAEIAGATGTMAVINNLESGLMFRPYQSTVQQALDYQYLKTYTIGEHYGPVNSLILSRLPQEDNVAISDQESIEEYGLTECKIANNEIMDDSRETVISPLFEAIKGIEWNGFEVETVGLGWLECGDRISITDDQNNVIEGVITNIQFSFDGGAKETIKGIIPKDTATNYALAGGITKTIYTTEIKVDKQGQEISAIVEEQSVLDGKINDNYTEITQNITNVITSVQNSGGSNLIKNSAMYSLDNDTKLPLEWSITGSGTLQIYASSEATTYGSLSGQAIKLIGKTATQEVIVSADNDSIPEENKIYYSFSCRAKKSAVGTATITLSDGTESGVWTIQLANGEASLWEEKSIEVILPNSTRLTVSVSGSSDSDFEITDMMLSVGNYRSKWSQANGEFANTQVSIDIDGVTIKSSNLDGSYAKQTSQGLTIFENNTAKAFVNGTTVSSEKIVASTEIDMPPIKIVPQRTGWAFVKGDR